MPDKVIASKTRETVLPASDPDYPGCLLVATAELHQLEGNSSPYFSLTGEVWRNREARTRYEREGHGDILAGGQLHEIILRAFPEFAPVARMHLATPEGEPMHAEANGWYWYSDHDGRGIHLFPHQEPMYSMTPRERAQHYLNAPELPPEGMTREEFGEWLEGLRAIWRQQADEALAAIRN